jgi:hypothetical protein
MHRARMLLARATLAALLGVAAFAAAGTTEAVAAGSPCGHMSRAPSWRHIVVIAFENHSYRDILGSSAPSSYFKTLAGECGSAVDYTAVHFPRSLPNYLGATSGKITTTSDCLPSAECSSGSGNIFSQVGGLHWRTFAESMPAPCYRKDTSLYVPRHAPAVYYTRIRRAVCQRDMVTLPSHPLQLKRAFTWIVPNLQHDMHDGSPAQASTWLRAFLGGPRGILHRRPYTNGHTAIFIWFDSAGASGSVSTPLPFIVVSPSTHAKVVRRRLNHYSSLRAWEAMLGLPCRNGACDSVGLRLPFNL